MNYLFKTIMPSCVAILVLASQCWGIQHNNQDDFPAPTSPQTLDLNPSNDSELKVHGPQITVKAAQSVPHDVEGCELFIEPIESAPGTYRVRLAVPESIKLLEIVPMQGQTDDRPVRVFVEQNKKAGCVQEFCRNDVSSPSKPSAIQKFTSNPFFTDPHRDSYQMAQQNSFFKRNEFDPESFDLGKDRVQQFDDSNPFLRARHSKPAIALDVPVSVAMVGPRSLENGMSAEFEAIVQNHTNKALTNLLLQIQLPEGLQPIDPENMTGFDESRRTLSWRLDQLASGETQQVNYRLAATFTGPQTQSVVIAVANATYGESTLETIVTAPFVPVPAYGSHRHAELKDRSNR